MKRRSAHAIENSTRGKKSEVRKWMLYYDRMEIAENAVRTQHHIQFEWMRADNREIVRQLQTIEELMHEIIEEENNVYENL